MPDEAVMAKNPPVLNVSMGSTAMSRCLAIRFGFDVLAIGDVALAPDNFRTDIESIGSNDHRVNHRSRVAYYSPTIGAMLSF